MANQFPSSVVESSYNTVDAGICEAVNFINLNVYRLIINTCIQIVHFRSATLNELGKWEFINGR